MNLTALKDQFVRELKADKKRAALLGILGVVALVMVVRLMTRGGASSAGAASAGGGVGDAVAGQSVRASIPRSKSDDRRADYLRNLDRTIRRDVFEPSDVFFPPPVAPDRPAVASRPLAPTSAPAMSREEIREKLIQEQARALEIQTVMLSDSPTAIINNRVLRVGDWVNGFEIVRITRETCVVQREGVEVTLNIRK